MGIAEYRNIELSTVYAIIIEDVTSKTVQFWKDHKLFRYKKSFILFMEKVK